MKKLIWVFIILPYISLAQSDSTRVPGQKEEKPVYRPNTTLALEILNIYDAYPSLLISLEKQFAEELAFLQEAGPVVIPESYNGGEFNRYFGFKGRSELKFYYDRKDYKNARSWIGIDISYQFDSYEDELTIDHGSYREFSEGEFKRYVIGSHVRVGTQRILSGGKILVSGSIGVGRSYFHLEKPEATGRVTSDTGIRNSSPLDPISVNVRLKLGVVLSER